MGKLLPLPVDALIAASQARVDVIAEARRASEATFRETDNAERWCKIALRSDTAKLAAPWAERSVRAALRASMHADDAASFAGGSEDAGNAAVLASSADWYATQAREHVDRLKARGA